MRLGGGKRRATAVAVALLSAVLGIAAFASIPAGATDSDLKHTYVFRLAASNGYSILAIAASQRADGRGEAVLFVGRKGAGVVYDAPATVSATRIEADLGRLGEVALDVVLPGRKTKLRSRCPHQLDDPRPISFERPLFRGTFEFHGEEEFAEASSSSPRDYSEFFLDVLCSGPASGELGGGGLPGARLRLHSREGSFRLNLQANKNRPKAGTRFEIATHEESGQISISRSRTLWVGAGAFDYDPLLQTATLDPPAPFSGRASFHRGAAAAERWTGNLTVDLPGRSNVPLASAGVGATLSHSCWQGEGAGGRAECGF